ncbi:MAG: LamG domain-containing protein [Pirellulales bacterium]|nr:LamG domain-containing protein [Pirellulales bacterium]
MRFVTTMMGLVFVIVFSILATPAHAELVLYWEFDETSGATAANTGTQSGNDGALINGATWNTDTPGLAHSTGSVHLAYSASAGQYVNFGDTQLLANDAASTPNSLTISVWFKAITGGNPNDKRLLSPQSVTGSSYNNYRSGMVATSTNIYSWDGSAGGLSLTAPISLDAWQHLAITSTGSLAYMYLNGQLVDAKNFHNFDFTGVNLLLGKSQYGATFHGRVDDMAIWNTNLSPGAIAQLAAGVAPTAITEGAPELPAYSQIVNVDINVDASPLPSYTGKGVIPAAGTVWNEPVAVGGAFDVFDAVDDGGAATGIAVHASGWTAAAAYAGNPLQSDHLYGGDTTTNAWQIDGLEIGRTYDLFFYGETVGGAGTVNVTSGATPTSADLLLFGDLLLEEDQPSDWVEGVSYAKLTVTPTDSTISGNFLAPTGVTMAFSGVQIAMVVPEPATLTHIFFGLLGVLAYAWRKRK